MRFFFFFIEYVSSEKKEVKDIQEELNFQHFALMNTGIVWDKLCIRTHQWYLVSLSLCVYKSTITISSHGEESPFQYSSNQVAKKFAKKEKKNIPCTKAHLAKSKTIKLKWKEKICVKHLHGEKLLLYWKRKEEKKKWKASSWEGRGLSSQEIRIT